MLAQNIPFPSPPHPLLLLIPLEEASLNVCFELACGLRSAKLPVEIDLTGKKLKNAMRYANTLNARFVAVIGENELLTKMIEIKEMATGHVEKLPFSSLEMRLKHELSKNG